MLSGRFIVQPVIVETFGVLGPRSYPYSLLSERRLLSESASLVSRITSSASSSLFSGQQLFILSVSSMRSIEQDRRKWSLIRKDQAFTSCSMVLGVNVECHFAYLHDESNHSLFHLKIAQGVSIDVFRIPPSYQPIITFLMTPNG